MLGSLIDGDPGPGNVRGVLARLKRRRKLMARYRLLRRLPEAPVVAEIGVWRGNFSAEILKRARPRELHLIDPWAFDSSDPKTLYGGLRAHDQADMDRICDQVRARFADTPTVQIHRATSIDTAPVFPDEHFDLVYVDGDHQYEAVLGDLTTYWPKIRPGGFLAGDDYDSRKWGAAIARAVRTFCDNYALRPRVRRGQFVMRRPG